MRRVSINGGNLSLMDYCSAGPQYASGGFIADSAFTGGTVINGSQQQFLVRNSSLDGWSNGVWNQVFSGDLGAPPQSFPAPRAIRRDPQYTTLATSPVTAGGAIPADRLRRGTTACSSRRCAHDSSGPSWAGGADARARPSRVSKFFIATPGTPALAIDAALALGKNLILTPGVYDLKTPIVVTRPNTVVLGLGFPTLVPQNGTAAMRVLGVPGVEAVRDDLRRRARRTPRCCCRWAARWPPGPAAPSDPVAGAGRLLPDRRGHGRARPPTASWSTAPTSSWTTSGPGGPTTARASAGPATPPTPAWSSTATT